MTTTLIVLVVLAILAALVLAKTIKIIPQARAGVVERFGKYRTTLTAGLNVVTPFVDRVRYVIDLREQVVSFPPQPVITEDNLVVSIDTVIYFQVTNAVSATYEIANYIQAIEQLTMTTLRQIIGGMTLEQSLTSRDQINHALRGVLDEATGKWGIRVNRVELKGIDPPPSIKDSMEKQMRADRDKRAAILTAEGQRQSAILTAEGSKQSSILTAEGDREAAILRAQADREAAILRAQGEGQAIQTVFQAIHDGAPDQSLLAYQYLQMLPKIAEGDANKVWVVPSEIGDALKGLGSTFGSSDGIPQSSGGPRTRVDLNAPVDSAGDRSVSAAHDEVAAAIDAAKAAATPGGGVRAVQPGVLPPAVTESSGRVTDRPSDGGGSTAAQPGNGNSPPPA
ncbi:MAG: Protein QmcA (possibly involved in integral membrane quality control) [uncultured Nocardioidaceae bacterium]|uniref:Protein QmcA (Possibly involved in integral membrane quality control) n=1 Tax=uncultured Nocardioidaceae bacterium TaxID=253824 RepID=A0A6J4MFM5_9ACTN|nr:MAG: Protein QmcA (possibly involved in integral membrane quality control) [uncultured Nocardioidaceae bacterium]